MGIERVTAKPSKAATARAAIAWITAEQARLAADRTARSFAAESKINLIVCENFLGDEEEVVVARHEGKDVVIRRIDGRAYVAWKEELVKLVGAEKVVELQERAEANPPRKVVVALE